MPEPRIKPCQQHPRAGCLTDCQWWHATVARKQTWNWDKLCDRLSHSPMVQIMLVLRAVIGSWSMSSRQRCSRKVSAMLASSCWRWMKESGSVIASEYRLMRAVATEKCQWDEVRHELTQLPTPPANTNEPNTSNGEKVSFLIWWWTWTTTLLLSEERVRSRDKKWQLATTDFEGEVTAEATYGVHAHKGTKTHHRHWPDLNYRAEGSWRSTCWHLAFIWEVNMKTIHFRSGDSMTSNKNAFANRKGGWY